MKIIKLFISLFLALSLTIGLFRPVDVRAASAYDVLDLVHAYAGATLDTADISELSDVWAALDSDIVDFAIAAGYLSAGATISDLDSIIQTVFADCESGVVNELTTFLHNLGSGFMVSLGTLGATLTDGVPGAFRFGAYSEYFSSDPSIRQQYSLDDCIRMGWNSYRSSYCRPGQYENLTVLQKAAINLCTLVDVVKDAFADNAPIAFTNSHVIEYDKSVVSSLGVLFTGVDIGDYFIDDVYISQNPIDGVYASLPSFYNTPVFEQVDKVYSYWVEYYNLSGVSPKFTPVALDSVPTFSSSYSLFNKLALDNNSAHSPSDYESFYVVYQFQRDPDRESGSIHPMTVWLDALASPLKLYILRNVPYKLYSHEPYYWSGDNPDGYGDFTVYSTVDPLTYADISQFFYTHSGRTYLGHYAGSKFDKAGVDWYYKQTESFNGSISDVYLYNNFSGGLEFSNSSYYAAHGYASGTLYQTSYIPTYELVDRLGLYNSGYFRTEISQKVSDRYNSFTGLFSSFYSTSPIPVYEIDFSGSGSPQLIDDTPPAPYSLTPPSYNVNGGTLSLDVLIPSDDISVGIKIDLPTTQITPLLTDDFNTFIQPVLNYYINLDLDVPITYNDTENDNVEYGDGSNWYDHWWNPLSVLRSFPISKIYNPLDVEDYMPIYPDVPSEIDSFIDSIPGTSETGGDSWYQWIADMIGLLPDDLMTVIWVTAAVGILVSIFFKIE